jgi:radical SAM protein with 4Fe4S-binding SPASM domain
VSQNCAHIDWPDDEVFFRDLFGRARAARVPLAGTLELTRRCNLRCVHCYLGPQARVQAAADREMTTAQVLGIIDQVVAAGCLSLLITGGDPLLRRDFAEVYRHARLSGLDVTVFTNGTLVTERTVDLFRDLPPRMVEITLYGATAETYDRIAGVAGAYERCLAGIRMLHDGGIRLGLKTMLMTANGHEFGGIEELARGFGARFRFDPLLTCRLDGGREPLGFRVAPHDAVRLEFADLERCQLWSRFREEHPVIAVSDKVVQCGAAETGFHVDAFGNLQPCLMLGDVSYDLRCGTFAEGWAHIASVRDVRATAGNRCTACELRPYCGYCPGLLGLESGDPERHSDYLCAMGAERLHAIIGLSEEQK